MKNKKTGGFFYTGFGVLAFLATVFFVLSYGELDKHRNESMIIQQFSHVMNDQWFDSFQLSGLLQKYPVDNFSDSLFMQSAIHFATAYYSYGKNDITTAHESLSQANDLLDIALWELNTKEQHVRLAKQKNTINQFRSLLEIDICVKQSVGAMDSLQFLLDQLPITKKLLEQREQLLVNFLLESADKNDEQCLSSNLSDTRRYLSRFAILYDEMQKWLDEYLWVVNAIRSDAIYCLRNDVFSNFPFEETKKMLLELEETIKQEFVFSVEHYVDHYCSSTDQQWDSLLEEIIEKTTWLMQKNKSVIQKQIDSFDDLWSQNFDEIISKEYKEHLQNIELWWKQWESWTKDLLKFNLTNSEKLLRDQYDEFYGDITDFVENTENYKEKIHQWER